MPPELPIREAPPHLRARYLSLLRMAIVKQQRIRQFPVEEIEHIFRMVDESKTYPENKRAILKYIEERYPIEYMEVRFLKPTDAFTGVDRKRYGPFAPGEVVSIPKADAIELYKKGNVEYIEQICPMGHVIGPPVSVIEEVPGLPDSISVPGTLKIYYCDFDDKWYVQTDRELEEKPFTEIVKIIDAEWRRLRRLVAPPYVEGPTVPRGAPPIVAPPELAPEQHPQFPEFVASMGFTMAEYWGLDLFTKRALRQAFIHWLAEKEKRGGAA